MAQRRVIPLLCLLVAVLLSCDRSDVIPRDDMARIYARMFLMDAQIEEQGKLRRTADTTRVYASILAEYGYDEDDFVKSQRKYLNDAGRYVRMMKRAQAMLEDENRELKAEKEKRDGVMSDVRKRQDYINKFRRDVEFLPDTAATIPVIPLDSLVEMCCLPRLYEPSEHCGPSVLCEPSDTL